MNTLVGTRVARRSRAVRGLALCHVGDQRSGALLIGVRDGDVVVLRGQSSRGKEVTLSVCRPVREEAEQGTPRGADRSTAQDEAQPGWPVVTRPTSRPANRPNQAPLPAPAIAARPDVSRPVTRSTRRRPLATISTRWTENPASEMELSRVRPPLLALRVLRRRAAVDG